MITRIAPRLLTLIFASSVLAACGGGGSGSSAYIVSGTAGNGGTISPESQSVEKDTTATLTLTPNEGYVVASASGCGGTFDAATNTFTTAPVSATCEVSATFTLATYSVSTSSTPGGSITATSSTVTHGDSTTLTVSPATDYVVDTVEGCGGTFDSASNTFTTGTVTTDCTVNASFALDSGITPLTLGYGIKQLTFNWPAVSGASYYRLLENPDGTAGYSQVGSNLTTTNTTLDIAVHRHDWANAKYMVEACNDSNLCVGSNEVNTLDSAVKAIGYLKASNAEVDDIFGLVTVLSDDGNTLAVTAYGEDSSASAVDGDQSDNSASMAGAVYIFARSNGSWNQQAYLKASNPDASDSFGWSLALSADGNTLAVSSTGEDSAATGINGDETDNSASNAGAVYLFTRSNNNWSQQAYIKGSNTEAGDYFGDSVSLSDDGNTLAVGAEGEDSNATGINGDEADNSLSGAGAVYVFSRSNDSWSQQAYVKASNTGTPDSFGSSVSLSGDGNALAVGASGENSNATGINGDETDNSLSGAGAVYVFTRATDTWSQEAYVKASNSDIGDKFGQSVAMSTDGNTMAVSALQEDSGATGIEGDQSDNSATDAGAVYVFLRSSGSWSQQAYIKASNTDAGEIFGYNLSLSGDGNALAVGSWHEGSSATGLNGNELDNGAVSAGAAYVFERSGTTWTQQAYVKAPNTDTGDEFGMSVSLSADGGTLAVGADGEASSDAGVVCATVEASCAASQADDSAYFSGALYLY